MDSLDLEAASAAGLSLLEILDKAGQLLAIQLRKASMADMFGRGSRRGSGSRMDSLDLETAVKGAGIIQLAQRLDKALHHAGYALLGLWNRYSGATASTICIVHDAHLPKWV